MLRQNLLEIEKVDECIKILIDIEQNKLSEKQKYIEQLKNDKEVQKKAICELYKPFWCCRMGPTRMKPKERIYFEKKNSIVEQLKI
jgi:hypothetical protein